MKKSQSKHSRCGGENYLDLLLGLLYHSQWSIIEKKNLIVKDKNLKSMVEEEILKAKRLLESEDMSGTPLFLQKKNNYYSFSPSFFPHFLSLYMLKRPINIIE